MNKQNKTEQGQGNKEQTEQQQKKRNREKQEQETIRDVDGYPIMNVYKDYQKCYECRERD
jgi:hypothetical protein